MAIRRKRRSSAPKPVAEKVTSVEQDSVAHDTEDGADEEEDDMYSKQSVEVEAVDTIEPEPKPRAQEPDMPAADGKLFALSRCRYSSGGKVIDAEVGDEIINPLAQDLQDLYEHNAVESFEPGQVQALMAIKSKAPEAKRRLAKMLGIL